MSWCLKYRECVFWGGQVQHSKWITRIQRIYVSKKWCKFLFPNLSKQQKNVDTTTWTNTKSCKLRREEMSTGCDWSLRNHSTPWAKIITRPGSIIISSAMWTFSHAITTTACLPTHSIRHSSSLRITQTVWHSLIIILDLYVNLHDYANPHLYSNPNGFYT